MGPRSFARRGSQRATFSDRVELAPSRVQLPQLLNRQGAVEDSHVVDPAVERLDSRVRWVRTDPYRSGGLGDDRPATPLPIDGEEDPRFPDRGGTFGGELTDGSATPADDGVTVPWKTLLLLAAVIGALAMPALARGWNRRSTRSLDPAQRVRAAWFRAQHAAEQAGVGGSPAWTAREWAKATADRLPVAARPMSSLAAIVDQVSFAPPGAVDLEHAGSYGSTLRHDCELWSNQVDRIAGDTMSLPQRVRHYFVDWR